MLLPLEQASFGLVGKEECHVERFSEGRCALLPSGVHAVPPRGDGVLLMLQYNPEDGRGRTKPVSQEDAIEELVQTVCSLHCHPCRRCFMQNMHFGG
jgi:hypothetical protein